MNAHLYSSPSDFDSVVGAVYRKDPVLFTTELTTLRTTPWPEGRILLSVSNGDGVAGAAAQMHGSVLLVSGLPPETATTAVRALASASADVPAFRGTPETAMAFTQAWHEVTGVGATVAFTDVLYRLGELVEPTGVAGDWRLSDETDTELLEHWLDAFFVEAFDAESNVEASRGMLRSITDAGGYILVWMVDGVRVSMARVHGVVAGMSRIGPVYTPPEHRGHGYAAAVTAAASRFARDRGAKDVVLFADSANPVSNRVYQRIGFHAVGENVQYTLDAGQPGSGG